MATFMSNDEWAIEKDYVQFESDGNGTGYLDKNTSPTKSGLDSKRRRAHGNIIRWIPGGVPKSGHEEYLFDLELRTVDLMLDEDQGRATEDGRPMYIPRDYIYERDRNFLASIGVTGFTRGVSH
jgi:hypothetical protein